MTQAAKYVVGTSGYSFADWVGPFYPPGTTPADMFAHYVRFFRVTELNFTFYAMPFPRTLASLASSSPAGFEFWVKANQEITHKANIEICHEFMEDLYPLRDAGKLAGVVLQFPQSFHRTDENRKYLADALDRMASAPLAVEFRHKSWGHPAVSEGLRQRNVTLVIPDVPDLPGLFHHPPAATSRLAYLRLHSRSPDKWYKGEKDRYDYHYSQPELREILGLWRPVEEQVDKVYVMFNNCRAGHAPQNALELQRMLEQAAR